MIDTRKQTGWAHTVTTAMDPPPVRGLSGKLFGATTDNHLWWRDAIR